MLWQIILYSIAIGLTLYVACSLIKTKTFSIANALAALAIVVSLILAQGTTNSLSSNSNMQDSKPTQHLNPASTPQQISIQLDNPEANILPTPPQASNFITPFLDEIDGTDNELVQEIPWWDFTVWGNQNGFYDPSGCYGVAWNPVGYFNTVVVFQQARELQFVDDPAGWSGKVCIQGSDIPVTAIEVGEIQRRWLIKRYRGDWNVVVLK